jgi:hypothetical protein
VPAVLLPHGVEEHPGDHHIEAVVFEGQPSHVVFVGDPVGWFRERVSWASKASEIQSVGAGADYSRERASSMSAGAGFPVGRSKGVGFRPLQRRRRYGRWAPEQTVRERESVVDGRQCRISGREEQGRRIPVVG